MSLRTQGLGLCPLRDSVLSQPMTQIHSTASLGPGGSGWQCGKGQDWRSVSGYGCECVCIPEEERQSPHRGQSLGKSAGSYSPSPLWYRWGNQGPGRKGSLPRVLQLVSGRSNLGSRGHLGFSPSSAPSQQVTAPFQKKEIKN